MRSRFRNPAAPRRWYGPRCPIPYPARAKSSSRSRRAPSTAPTCCSARASTIRRPARPRTRAWSARAGSPRSGRESPAGPSATRSARCSPAADTPRRSPYRRGSCCPCRGGWTWSTAAALPEVACTVWSNVFMVAHLRPGETLLVHGGASGIGTMAIQLAQGRGRRVAVTAGGADRSWRAVPELGADILINYREQDFVEEIRKATGRRRRGRHPRHHRCEVPGAERGGPGRQRPARGDRYAGRGEGRARISARCWASAAPSRRPRCGRVRWPRRRRSSRPYGSMSGRWSPTGGVRPVVDRALPMSEAAEAHRVLETGGHVGKLLLLTSATA